MTRRPADPEEELRWMSQEVRGYVEAVLNSLAANVPKVGLHRQLCTFCPSDQPLRKCFETFCDWLSRQLFFAKLKKPRKTC